MGTLAWEFKVDFIPQNFLVKCVFLSEIVIPKIPLQTFILYMYVVVMDNVDV